METMKKFKKYFINFIVLMLIVTGLTYYGTKNYNKEKKEEIINKEDNENNDTDITNKESESLTLHNWWF